VPAATGAPSITPAAITALVTHFTAVNNTANHSNDFALLTQIDSGLERTQDAAYTKAGRVNGEKVPAFYTSAVHVAVPTTATSPHQYAVVEAAAGEKPPVHAKLPANSSPLVSVYVKMAQGWRLANSVGLTGSHAGFPAFARPTAAGVTSPAGSTKGAANASARVVALANACATKATSPLVAKPTSCGQVLDAVRSVSQFHVTASLGSQRWPTYIVALTGGQTLVIGAAELAVRVSTKPGEEWRTASVVTGLLGLAAKRDIPIGYGYVEQTSLSVALIVPANGGQAQIVGVESGDLSARALKAPRPAGSGVSV
jgi:hypothetical protein